MPVRGRPGEWSGRLLRRVASRLGYDVLPRGPYSVVPDLDKLGEDVFDRRSPLYGINFDVDRKLAFAREHLRPWIYELGGSAGAWTPDATPFGAVDGEVLYSMVRHLRPARVVELGAGYSTHVIAAAVRANASEGRRARFDAYEPYPPDVIGGGLPGLDTLHRVRAQDVPDSVFADLGAQDVLFVDTTHTVKVGGDVNRIVLDILPRLADGVVVHFHDVFLPGEYHRAWLEHGWYWAEQYLVQAFLCLNPEYEVVWGSAGVWLERREELHALVPSLRDHRPSSFWIRRTSRPRAA